MLKGVIKNNSYELYRIQFCLSLNSLRKSYIKNTITNLVGQKANQVRWSIGLVRKNNGISLLLVSHHITRCAFVIEITINFAGARACRLRIAYRRKNPRQIALVPSMARKIDLLTALSMYQIKK